ncbi:MAG: polyphosphate kinase 2 [Bacteroidetes bacterium]|nr:MAG: polyphosphate kinase 2 [Bacteroidota bacterium]
MAELPLSPEDLEILNSKIGLKYLMADKKVNVERALRLARYELSLRSLQTELIKMQQWVIEQRKRVVILFEGRDAAGKGGAIRRMTAHINPRHYRIMALPKPTEEERGQWYFQRYVNRLPKPGEIVFFDRSWYNRAVVEPVNGFCTPEEYAIFMGQVNHFEKMIIESGTYLIKFYFSITKEEQARRFKDIKSSPLKKWKMTPVDERAQELWDIYTEYKQKMFAETHTPHAPWLIIEANQKTFARVEATRQVLARLPYPKDESTPELPEITLSREPIRICQNEEHTSRPLSNQPG